MNQSDQITGIIERCVFHNKENGFTVFILKINARETVTVCGHLSQVTVGEQISARGSWTTHPKFGKQFQAQECVVQVPTTILGLKKYLGSGLIKGIGPIYAQKLVDYFGTQVLDIIDQFPERLCEIDGIGPSRKQTIIEAWKEQKEVANIMVFLREKGISAVYAAKIFKQYKQQSLPIIQENPYRLADDIWGIGFKTADTIAQQLGFAFDSAERIASAIKYLISNATTQGHLYYHLDKLISATIELLELTNEHLPLVESLIQSLHQDQTLSIIPHQDQYLVTLSQYHACEKSVAQRLDSFIKKEAALRLDIQQIYNNLRLATDIQLTEDQQRGILACLQNRITIITGGPGTGKTTLIKKLLDILDSHRINYKLTAPTGRAAKRMSESTRRPALTLHRLLEFDPSTARFLHHEQNALDLDYLIVDESSMIDIFLMNSLIKAIPFNAHLVFIGDVDQLPSVGAGNVLRDLIASNQIPVVRLHTIFRQAHNSLIVVNAHRINQGEFPVIQAPDAKKDFIFIKEQDPTNIKQHIESTYKKLSSSFNIHWHDTMVLSPMHRTLVGTQTLNTLLKEYLNPISGTTIMHMGISYSIGDRVMQLRNNYDKKVFNGDIGYIENIQSEERIIQVAYPEGIVTYEGHEFDEITLAYAISIHKSQGSEFPVVIIPLFMQHFILLQRNLLYTAITRAKKMCLIIGQPQAVAMAIKNNKEVTRLTLLKELIMQRFCV